MPQTQRRILRAWGQGLVTVLQRVGDQTRRQSQTTLLDSLDAGAIHPTQLRLTAAYIPSKCQHCIVFPGHPFDKKKHWNKS
jgi:hypothetical protein